jgi:magnesium transporter
MSKKQRHRPKRKKGLAPGTLVYTGPNVSKTYTTLFQYDEKGCNELPISKLADALTMPGHTWLDQRGLEDVNHIEQLCSILKVHPLAIEDILNTHQRAKLEEYQDGLFFVMHHIAWKEASGEIQTEQIALHWNSNYVASFQELPDDTFAYITDKLKDPTKKHRQNSPDYLAYTLIDYIVDSYFDVLDSFSEKTDEIQDRIQPNVNLELIRTDISELRQHLSTVKRAILPLREALHKLTRSDIHFIEPANHIYFRDVHDHIGQITDYLDNLYEDLNATHELYQAEMNQRLNVVMKLLTMISTIFIPLSFIAGVYGMNFDNMPELRTKNGYFITLGVMFFAAMGMLFYFRRQRWL